VLPGIITPPRIVLTDPRGPRFTQEVARRWAQERHIILLCGHYEGVDERVRQHLVTDEISIGDYILTGGELPALVIVDALTRLQPGALGDEQAPDRDTFTENLLEYPHYTRPRVFHGWAVPDILLCGHHALIERWRRWHQLRATRERRPDLFAGLELSPQDILALTTEEPTAPPDEKAPIRAARAARKQRETRAVSMEEATERKEYSDGTGTGNHT
jgi:tRNA (guanine37-N1)-methyltransferase